MNDLEKIQTLVRKRRDRVVALREKGLSFTAIGRKMGISQQAACALYHRATALKPLKISPDPEDRTGELPRLAG